MALSATTPAVTPEAAAIVRAIRRAMDDVERQRQGFYAADTELRKLIRLGEFRLSRRAIKRVQRYFDETKRDSEQFDGDGDAIAWYSISGRALRDFRELARRDLGTDSALWYYGRRICRWIALKYRMARSRRG